MATDTRKKGYLFMSRYRWRDKFANSDTWRHWRSWVNGQSNLGLSEAITSERGKRYNAVVIGKKLVWDRKLKQNVWKWLYAKRPRQHQPPNPMFHSRKESDGYDMKSLIFTHSTGYQVEVKGNFCGLIHGFYPETQFDVPYAQKVAASRLYQDASANSFDAYLQVGELMETLQMLKNPLASLREAGTVLWHKMRKRTRHLQGEDLKEAISGAWLEYSFGVAPLIFGTAEIAGSLVDALTNTRLDRYRKASAFMRESSGGTLKRDSFDIYVGAYKCSIEYHEMLTDEIEVNSGMTLVNDQRQMSHQARMGMDSMRSFVGQAWALLPLSFAIDWFVGVGPLIDECRPIRGRILHSYTGVLTTTSRTIFAGSASFNSSSYSPVEVNRSLTLTNTQATRITNISPPGSILAGPGLFSLSQGMSLAALSVAPLTKLWRKLPWH
jgi:hypothetical protein